jgi:DNA polymerase-1
LIEPLDVAAPTWTLPVLPPIEELHQQILLGLGTSKNTKENIILISYKPKPRKTKKREGKHLSMLEPEEIPASGECPGGKYYYIDSKNNLMKILHHWLDREAWVAIDLETGIAWREKPDPESDDMIRYYEEVIDPYTCPIYLVSMSVEPGISIVFDMRPFKDDPEFLALWCKFLVTCKFVAHNCMFEQCFLCAQFGVVVNFVYDTMLVHQLMTAGLDIGSGLADMLDRYCGVKLDKQWQKFFLSLDPRSPLAAECIAYSAGDVCQLLTLVQKLEVELKESGLHHIWTQYEQPFMKWMALAKVEGIGVNTSFFETLNAELAVGISQVLSEFESLCPGVLISSPVQVKTWFAKQGITLRSTNIAALEKLKELPEIGKVAGTILIFRKLQKMKGTYIEPMIRTYPSPVTRKIHPNWGQLFTATGRMNCSEPNFQNMPSRDEWVKIRNGFIAKPGHKLAYCDYSQYEVRAMADMADEQNMIAVFDEAAAVAAKFDEYITTHSLPKDVLEWHEKKPETYKELCEKYTELPWFVTKFANLDFHKRTAAMLFNTPIEEVTKAQRQKAKTITFAKPYGAGPKKIAQQAGIEIDEAKRLFYDYDDKFPKLAAFLEKCREQAKRGHTESPTGRRRFYQMPNFAGIMTKVKAIAKAGGNEWEEMVETWGTSDAYELTNKLHSAKIGAIEREGMNHPIQACNADATKLATILAAPRLQKLDKECIIIAWVHDEIILTAPDPLIDAAANILRDAMIEAALKLLVRTPVDVSISTGYCWGK